MWALDVNFFPMMHWKNVSSSAAHHIVNWPNAVSVFNATLNYSGNCFKLVCYKHVYVCGDYTFVIVGPIL